MTFGELREAVHRGDWGVLADATLSPDQEGYVNRMVGGELQRYKAARLLLEADDPFDYEIRIRAVEEAGGCLDGVLRWYACDLASETMRLYGNGDPRSLKTIEVVRQYVLGEVGEEELKRARQAARAAASDARASAAASDARASAAAYSAAAYSAAYDAARAASAHSARAARAASAHSAYASYASYASYAAYYDEALANLEGWFRCYLMRWVEEGSWWA